MTIKTLLLDIEGTVCSISFVKDTLFPYFLLQLPQYLSSLKYPIDADQNEVSSILSKFPDDVTANLQVLSTHINNLVTNDIKDPVLKSFQGLVWQIGYDSGDLRAPVYKDAIDLITRFSKSNKVYIYSSGSIKAQKLLFGHVDGFGDLNPYLSGYFDITTSGFKTDATSYTSILKDIGHFNDPENVLFLSDNVKEVNAAISAGLKSKIALRPGNADVSDEDLSRLESVSDFSKLDI